MTARLITSAEFERLVIANPEAVVEVDVAASEYHIRTATGRSYRTAFGDLNAAMAVAVAADPSHTRAAS